MPIACKWYCQKKKIKLLDIIFDDRFKIQYLIKNFCKKARALELRTLSLVTPFLNLPPKKVLLKVFFQ